MYKKCSIYTFECKIISYMQYYFISFNINIFVRHSSSKRLTEWTFTLPANATEILKYLANITEAAHCGLHSKMVAADINKYTRR